MLQSLWGGVLIGLASWLVLAALGRVTGISGIVSGILAANTIDKGWRIAFIAGLVLGGAVLQMEQVVNPQPLWLIAIAGLLVGLGTVLGSGCTSGHGVCGLARGSKRSFASVAVFMVVGMITVTLMRVWQ